MVMRCYRSCDPKPVEQSLLDPARAGDHRSYPGWKPAENVGREQSGGAREVRTLDTVSASRLFDAKIKSLWGICRHGNSVGPNSVWAP
jgi:hypothetical protein